MSASDLSTGQLQRLLAVGRSMVSKRDPEAVLEDVLNAARELTGARYAALGTLAPDRRELDRFLFVGIDEETRERIGPLPTGHGILGELIRDPRPLRLARISDHPRSYGFPAGHPRMESFLGVPVMIHDQVFGNLYLSEKAGGAEFTEEDERVLVVLAEWAAIAIDNARAHQRANSRRRDLERAMLGLQAIVALSREVEGETDLPRVLELVTKRGRALIEARSCLCMLLDGDNLTVTAIAGEVGRDVIGARLSPRSTAEDAVRAGHGQPIGERTAAFFTDLGLSPDSGFVVPMRARGVDVGALTVLGRTEDRGEFTPDDLLALESFASSAAGAIAATRAIADEKVRLAMLSSERERQRWARELHDEALQELGALNVSLETALQVDDPAAVRHGIARAHEQIAEIIDGIRGLINDVRPAALDQLGLAAGVETLAERLAERSGMSIDLDIDLAHESRREATRLGPELESIIYRTVQEALNNVVKHAGTNQARVSIEERDGTVAVVVEDDGRGFEPSSDHEGFGLLGMHERASLAGGELTIGPGPRGGTRVRAEFPVTRASDGPVAP
jgi:signal transduction histidine kinase